MFKFSIITSILIFFLVFCNLHIDAKNLKKANDDIIFLKKDNHVILRGQINSKSASLFINKLNSFYDKPEVYIYISSGGGSVVSGMEIIRTMKALEKNGVSVKCIGDVALSMAFVILQYCPVRYTTISSIVMQHQTSLGLEGPMANVLKRLALTQSMECEINLQQANRLNMTLDRFTSLVHDDWWLFGNNIINNNVADKIVDIICDFTPENIYVSMDTFFGPVKITYSSCPLSRSPLDISFSGRSNKYLKYINKVSEMYDMNKYIEKLLYGKKLR